MMNRIVNRILCICDLQRTMSVLLTLLLLLTQIGSVSADVRDNKISLIKSAFVYNIGRFITWSPSMYEAHPNYVTLCFYQQDVLGRGFKSVYKKQIQHRKLIRKTIESLAESEPCDMLYVSSMALPGYLSDHQKNDEYGYLTIADMTDTDSINTIYNGIMMNLIRQGTSIGFEVNLTEVSFHGLEISSELLKMATILNKEE